jgi:hypothetical protein
VRGCWHNKNRQEHLSVWVWEKDDPSKRHRVPYVCNSWRCPYGCRVHVAQVLFARVKSAFEGAHGENRSIALRVSALRAELEALPLAYSGKASEQRALRKQQRLLRALIAHAEACPSKKKLWKGLVFVCLTLPGHMHEAARADLGSIYEPLGKMSEQFKKRLKRWMSRQGMRQLGNEYVITVEAHKSGVPHLNLVMWSPQWAALLRTRKRLETMVGGLTEKESIILEEELQEEAINCGFGHRSTAEACRRGQEDKLFGYIVKTAKDASATSPFADDVETQTNLALGRELWNAKLAGERTSDADQLVAELVKDSQLPVHAKLNFRRVRSGKGFLPPKIKKPGVTGCVVRRRQSNISGSEDIEPLVKSSDEAYMAQVYECCRREHELRAEERHRRKDVTAEAERLKAERTARLKPEAECMLKAFAQKKITLDADEVSRLVRVVMGTEEREQLVTTHRFELQPEQQRIFITPPDSGESFADIYGRDMGARATEVQ